MLKVAKSVIREKHIKQRKLMPTELLKQMNEQILDNILDSFELNNAYVAIYYPINNEVDIRNIRYIAKKTLLPIINYERKDLSFAVWDGELVDNKFGIPEPKSSAYEMYVDYVFVPVVAFNNSLNRIGYGGGYYDRTIKYFKDHIKPTPKFIGVAYSSQLEHFEAENFDMRLDAIITENGLC